MPGWLLCRCKYLRTGVTEVQGARGHSWRANGGARPQAATLMSPAGPTHPLADAALRRLGGCQPAAPACVRLRAGSAPAPRGCQPAASGPRTLWRTPRKNAGQPGREATSSRASWPGVHRGSVLAQPPTRETPCSHAFTRLTWQPRIGRSAAVTPPRVHGPDAAGCLVSYQGDVTGPCAHDCCWSAATIAAAEQSRSIAC
jgi:hypothetical protein